MTSFGDAEDVNISRRRLLIRTTAAISAVGVTTALVSFVESWNPNERARADSAPISQDLSQLAAGQMIVVAWQSKPVYILHRTDEMLQTLSANTASLIDPTSNQSMQPDYARNAYRSRDPRYLVMVAVCTHLGCTPGLRADTGAVDLGQSWVGGFLCPCHGSRYDLAGRVFQNSPAPMNMAIPKHKLVGTILTIGEDA